MRKDDLEVVTDPLDLEAVKNEAGAFQLRHPKPTVGPSPLPAFLARKAQFRAMATAMLKRHDEAQQGLRFTK